ncbi:MAG TPA: hypothetical protein VKZ43_03570 [Trueperaceae bacterium]|nr:hypothetical protein [Trueperaceae bacterium]
MAQDHRSTVIQGLLLIAVLVAACAPAAGRTSIAYQATQEDVVAVIAQFGPQIEPPAGYNFFSIETISQNSVTLYADLVAANAVVRVLTGMPGQPAKASITTFERQGATTVAVSVSPSGLTEVYDSIIMLLDSRFRRAG